MKVTLLIAAWSSRPVKAAVGKTIVTVYNEHAFFVLEHISYPRSKCEIRISDHIELIKLI